jgi:perosamine synthetase
VPDSLLEVPDPHFSWPPHTAELEAIIVAQAREALSIPDNSGIVADFEAEFAIFHGRRHAVTFNSGTSALFAAFFALELSEGDNVIVPNYTFFATASPLVFFPVQVRFADCDESGNITAESILSIADHKTKAVVVTHMWGVPCDMAAIVQLCNEKRFTLIEDCSHAHGARYDGRLCGSFGDIAIWSLQGQKLISGGEGGILVTDNDRVLELALLLGHYNKRCVAQIRRSEAVYSYATTGFGLKLRAHPIAVAIAKYHFSLIGDYLDGRAAHVAPFLSALSKYDFIRLPDLRSRQPAWYSLAFQFDEAIAALPREAFLAAVSARGCNEIEAPGATRQLTDYPLFRSPPQEFGFRATFPDWDRFRPASARYQRQVVKMPVWTFPAEREVASLYLGALVGVCEAIRRGQL